MMLTGVRPDGLPGIAERLTDNLAFSVFVLHASQGKDFSTSQVGTDSHCREQDMSK